MNIILASIILASKLLALNDLVFNILWLQIYLPSNLRNTSLDHSFTLSYLIDFYKKTADHKKFIDRSQVFNRLAGNAALQQQLKDGLTEEEILKSWEHELTEYQVMRKKYLLYPDFE